MFLGVPHGAAVSLVEALDAAGCPRIVDASRDHRHAPGWVYGQPEWNAEALVGAGGLLLVLIILYAFLSKRVAFWVAVGI